MSSTRKVILSFTITASVIGLIIFVVVLREQTEDFIKVEQRRLADLAIANNYHWENYVYEIRERTTRQAEAKGTALLPYTVIFGSFLGSMSIGIILLIIYLIITEYERRNPHLYRDSEIIKLENEIIELNQKKKLIKEKYRLLKKSYSQGLLDSSKFESEDKQMKIDFDNIKKEISTKTKRVKAIEILKEKFKTIDEMFDKRLLTASETSLKKEELIEKLISRMN